MRIYYVELISKASYDKEEHTFLERIFFTEEEAKLFSFNANNWLKAELKKIDESDSSEVVENIENE